MIRNFKKITRKSFGCMLYSNHKNPFKYLSAPVRTSIQESKLPPPTKIDEATIKYLESVSLVGFENDRAVKIVEEAIRFADQLFEVNTDNVEPLTTVLEDECLYLRKDIAKTEITRSELLSHTIKCVEYYYVTPGGHSKKADDKEESIPAPKIKKSAL